MAAFKINDRIRVKERGGLMSGQAGTVIDTKCDCCIIALDNGTLVHIGDRFLEKETKEKNESDFKINDRVRVKSTGQVGTVVSVKWYPYVTVHLGYGGLFLRIKEKYLEKESENQQTTDAVIFQLSYAAWDNDSDDGIATPMNPKDVAEVLSKLGTGDTSFFCVEEVKEEIEEQLEYWDNVAGFVNGEMFYAHKTTTYVGKLFE